MVRAQKRGKNRENEVSFLETENSPDFSERFANYIIRGNYQGSLPKKSDLSIFVVLIQFFSGKRKQKSENLFESKWRFLKTI